MWAKIYGGFAGGATRLRQLWKKRFRYVEYFLTAQSYDDKK